MKLNLFNSDLEIREADVNDYRYCYQLTKDNMLDYFTKYWGGWNPKVFEKNFNIKETFMILRNDNIVGYYVIKNKSDHYYIDNIQISSTMRGKGIGSKILIIIEKQVIDFGFNIIRLEVFKDNPAKKLYDKFNYKIIEDKDTSVVMEKKLK